MSSSRVCATAVQRAFGLKPVHATSTSLMLCACVVMHAVLLLCIAVAACRAEHLIHRDAQIAGHTELEARIEHEVLADLRDRISAHTRRADAASRGDIGRRPFLTLTYAQSIDGSIAAAGNQRLSFCPILASCFALSLRFN
jgi:hypothetical protein